MDSVKETYTKFHLSRATADIYPSEWVIRTLLGKYPLHAFDTSKFKGAKILDVGFGDGRNWPLFRNVQFEVHGVEITEEIVALGRQRAKRLGMAVTLKVGTNASLPFGNDFFDYLLASSSCYYVDKGSSFAENLQEYHRVLKPGGVLMATLPEANSSIFEGAMELDDGHVEIRGDQWGLRNGYLFRRFHSESELRDALSPYFDSFAVGLCCDNYYGYQVNLFLVVCRKKH